MAKLDTIFTDENRAVIRAGLWAQIFQQNPTVNNLTRWCDLTQLIEEK